MIGGPPGGDSRSTQRSFSALGEQAALALAPETGAFADVDPAGLLAATVKAVAAASGNPGAVTVACLEFTAALARVPVAAVALAAGLKPDSPVPVNIDDRRFANAAWRENAGYFALRQAYEAARRLNHEILSLCPHGVNRTKAELTMGLLFDALSPTNYLITNPDAIQRTLETGGTSLLRGLGHFTRDVLTNRGRPRQVDRTPFQVGENLASTPGKIVFRNDLMELIQYAPQTPEVHSVPLLASPPWINKYYIMDLAPGRSFIEWAVRHNRTVFAISYRNPDRSMRDVTMDDYLVEGPRTALDVIEDITGSRTVDIVGLCLGGALTAVTAAYLAEVGDDRIGTLTLLNTMLDYSEPGPLGTFTDEKAVSRLERKMAKSGLLEAHEMSATFDILRPNDLIFNYIVTNWLMGDVPPVFDILAWNADSTRMPAQMHSFYLRAFYVDNSLATGTLEIAGKRLSLQQLTNDTYVVAAINDHIVPWQASYKSVDALDGNVRFVLSSGGHIAGIVNPPGPKGWYEIAPTAAATADEWRTDAERVTGSWWEDWTEWANERAGDLVQPPEMGSARFPASSAAPGRYVHS